MRTVSPVKIPEIVFAFAKDGFEVIIPFKDLPVNRIRFKDLPKILAVSKGLSVVLIVFGDLPKVLIFSRISP